ncbi:hypothetical protein OG417_09720 [Actinoallomurus sp. NBC_01490]|uniref:hypothetical protein n=1 Tax=Actinoallomurus sp. NBC_01490 TaxID=2903557 RepID=UPI002E35F895|nr:hypothetical protein [Actinoallomurus sp. NBC_01490]
MKSRHTLERRTGGRRERVILQSSMSNRTGGEVRIRSVLNVRDDDLRAWRRANPRLTAPYVPSGGVSL